MNEEEFEDLRSLVIASAIEVHRQLGAGLLESVYEAALAAELRLRGIPFQSQVSLPVIYKGEALKQSFRIDFLVAGCLVVELKAVQTITGLHVAQALTYLKLGNFEHGLLLNFNVILLRDGIRRLQKPSAYLD